MDRALVVAYRIDDGRKLLNRLLQDGLEISAAFWMYTNDNERWGLYIVSECMNTIGIKNSYMKVVLAMKAIPGLRIDHDQVTLLEPTRPLAVGVIDRIARFPGRSDHWIETTVVNGVYVEMAYVYPMPTMAGLGVSGPGSVEKFGPTLQF